MNRRILQHLYALAEYTDLTDDERQHLLQNLVLLGHKLASVWIHLDRYQTVEDRLIAEAEQTVLDPSSEVWEVAHSQDLFLEFDEFLVQVKSSLDYLVKIPVPILGAKRWSLSTFGDKGEKVVQALRRNVPKPKQHLAEGIIGFLKNHRPWLEDAIRARDGLNHYLDGIIPFERFSVYRDPTTEPGTIRIPMWNDEQSIRELMGVVWENLIFLVEDFAVGFLSFRVQPGLGFFHNPPEPGSVRSPWVVKTERQLEAEVAAGMWRRVERDSQG